MRTRIMAMVTAGALAASVLVACSSSGPPQQVSAGAETRSSSTTGPSGVAPSAAGAAPGSYDQARARYEALVEPAGAVDAHGPHTVVRPVTLTHHLAVHSRSGRVVTIGSAQRLTIAGGPFPYGGARIVVFSDGHSLGEGRPGPGSGSLSIGVLDPALVRPGSVISYRIGDRPTVTVGALAAGS